MKKLYIIALILLLSLTLFGCRRNNPGETTVVTETEITLLPEIDPTLETNIPDPEVDTSMPDSTDIMDEFLDPTNDQNRTIGESGRKMLN